MLERSNDTSQVDKIMKNGKGQDIIDILDKYFYLLHERRKIIFDLPPVTYKFHYEIDVVNREMMVVSFP